MMATTHALAGLALGAVVAALVPEAAAVALLAGMAGGGFPDLDLYSGHRRALHYPVGYALVTLPAAALAAVHPTAVTVGLATFLAAAALHAASDVLGGGLELHPWRAESDRAVYDHVRGQWLAPRRWIRYDGAPEDVALGGALAVPPLLLVGDGHGFVGPLAGALVATSVIYAVVRRRIPDATRAAVAVVPDGLEPYVPERFYDEA